MFENIFKDKLFYKNLNFDLEIIDHIKLIYTVKVKNIYSFTIEINLKNKKTKVKFKTMFSNIQK